MLSSYCDALEIVIAITVTVLLSNVNVIDSIAS